MVQLIPQQQTTYPIGKNLFFYAAAGVFLLSVVGFFALGQFLSIKNQELEEIEAELDATLTPEEQELEARMQRASTRLGDLDFVLEERTYPLNLFLFLEQHTHPEVTFTSLDLTSADARAILAGRGTEFVVLGQQMLVFEGRSQDVQEARLSDIGLHEEGGTAFEITLQFSRDIFGYNASPVTFLYEQDSE